MASAPNRSSSGCLKVGCVVVVLIVAGLLILGVGSWYVARTAAERPVEVRDQTVERPLPSQSPAETQEGSVEATTPGELGDALEPEAGSPSQAASGELILDLAMGKFEVRPIPAGEPLRIESHFDANRFELVETFEAHDNGSWTQRVKFGPKGGSSRLFFFGKHDASDNLVLIFVPAASPFTLEAEIRMGESNVDLSGLAVTAVDLDVAMGAHELVFHTATATPLESIRVDGRMGEVSLRGLGWASPSRVEAEHAMGELVLIASGPWRQDSSFDLETRMGPIRLDVPADVRLDMAPTTVKMGSRNTDDRPEPPAGAATLTVRSKVSMGEIRVRTIAAGEQPSPAPTELALDGPAVEGAPVAP